MTPAQWRTLAAPLLGDGWRLARLLAYRVPVGWLVDGLLAEKSGSGGFYLWQVQAPLYVPTTVLDLSWSARVGGGSTVYEPGDVAGAAIEAAAAQVVAISRTREGVQLAPPSGAGNVLMQEARAYALVLGDEVDSAMEVLDQVGSHRARARYQWEHDFFARVALVRGLLEAGEIRRVLDLLSSWREGSAAALGLELA